ncbi:phenylacetate--CoA ligase family protein [Winogradskyella haliclonae]|uniref:AMP-binding protein n=1 Tax=Winogradskyella haliclonae TaxID=2048558 RepID=A0ABQ2BZJ4_9FLAO|nr:phenylacetate--CoA ligase family protein [Winogradskyella haliclonae]GGI56303.1 AMP-binding protein [Winogradskyella haliclonae]
MRIFDLSLLVKGFAINKAKQLLSEIQEKSDEDFETYILKRKKSILHYHEKHNSFYKSKVKSIDLNNWVDIPIITKKDLQQPLSQLLTEGFNSKNVYIGKTSGSSGDPFVFAKDKFCHALTWAQIMNRFSWYGIDFNSSKQARFYGIPLDKKGYSKERIKDLFANRYRFSVFDLSDEAFEKVLEKFRKTPFDYINGYTSPIVQFAKFLKRKDIVLKDVCPTLNVCIVTSEMLYEKDKDLLDLQFGIPTVNEYGASELDLIAFENPDGEWQINSETLFVEILDNDNKPVPYGTEGRVVITSLYNKASPFIRYDIGDIGVLSKQSTLRKPILEKLVGRTNDIAILPSGKKAAGLTFYYITKSIIEEDGNVNEFIIEQLEFNHFKVSYVSKTKLTAQKKETITNAMVTYLEKGITITFEKFEKLNRSKSGKLKQFTSYVSTK